MMKTVLTIAGSDSIGGAGIQADIKAVSANGCYAMSVITSVTAQNTMGVDGIFDIPADFVEKQLRSVFNDIRPDAVKIGMLSSRDIIDTVAGFLEKENAENIALDTVMVSTSGHRLISEDSVDSLIEKLFPLADIVTPNLPEAEVLAGVPIESREQMKSAAEKIYGMCRGSVLIKGGHLTDSAEDILYNGNRFYSFEADKLENPNTHGTGCTLSSAIAANLALGRSMAESVKNAKDYITGAIRYGLDLGKGRGPLNHFYKNGAR